MNKNQIAVDIGRFYVADATEANNALTYGTPAEKAGAASVAIAMARNPVKAFESGEEVFNRTYVRNATLTLVTKTLSVEDKMDLFYSQSAPAGDEAYEIGADSDTPKRVAVGFPVPLADGKYLCTWFLDTTAAPPDENYTSSNESGPQLQDQSIEFTCKRRPGDSLMFRRKIVDDATAMAEFFASVEGDTPDVEIGAIVYNVTAPVKSASAQATHDAGTGYTAAIVWAPADATFGASTAYKATVTYTAAAGYAFPADFAATDVQGLPTSGTTAKTVIRVSGTSVKVEVTYSETEA